MRGKRIHCKALYIYSYMGWYWYGWIILGGLEEFPVKYGSFF